MKNLVDKYLGSASWLRAPEGEAGAAAGADANAGAAAAAEGGGGDARPAGEAGADAGQTPAPPAGESPPAGGETPSPGAPAASSGDGESIQRRIDRLTAEKWTERRGREQAESQVRLLQERLTALSSGAVAAPAAGSGGEPVPAPAPAAAPPGRLVVTPEQLQSEAQKIAAQTQFNNDVASEITKGRGAHNDFDQIAGNLQRFGELPRTFVEGALATGKGAEVIYSLGKDLAEADRILSLPPMQQAVALATLAGKIQDAPKPKLVSDAPAPITPRVGGTKASTPDLADDKLDIAQWMELREKQVAANPRRR